MALFSAAAKGDMQQLQSAIEEDSGFDVNYSDSQGKTPIHIASHEGHLETVEYLISHGAHVQIVDITGQTPLHVASKKGHLQIIKVLANEGADINKCDKDGFTALHLSSFEGHHDTVKYLVKKGAELDKLSKDYWTPLHLALGGGHLNIVEYLLIEGAKINTCSTTGFTAVHTASQCGNIEGVKYLISQGAELHGSTVDGWTSLSLASHEGHLDIVKVLVKAGVELDKALSNGMTSLILATKRGHLDVVEVLLKNGASIDKCNKDGFTALHTASSHGHLELVKYLVSKGAQLGKCDNKGRTPLYCASQGGHLEIVKYLVNEGADMKESAVEGFTVLHIASFRGHLDIVKYLDEKGAYLEIQSNDHWTPLHLALGMGHLDIVKYLSLKGVSVNKCSKTGFTALHTASQTGNIEGVKYLTSQGAELDGSSDDGWTPLSLASHGGHVDIVKVLVNEGVELDKALKNGMTPLILATEGGHFDIVEVLLKKGAAIDKCNRYGFTALHTASSHGHLEIVQYLVRKGAQLDKYDTYGRTPLFYASQGGHLEIGAFLANEGTDIKNFDNRWLTALHIASFMGHVETVKYLVVNGAQLNKCDSYYRTPLYCASQEGHFEIVQYLVNKGADINTCDKKGFSVLHIASFKGHLEIVKYLVGKGANVEKLSNDNWTPIDLAVNCDHLAIVDYLVKKETTKSIQPDTGLKRADEKMKDLDVYDEWASFAPTKYVTISSGMRRDVENQNVYECVDVCQPCGYYVNLEPDMTPMEASLVSHTAIQRQCLRDPTKSIKEETLIRLDKFGIEIRIPSRGEDENITVEALTNIPPDLNLKKDEVIISVGLKLSPPGLQFKSPVEVTVLHSAILTKPEKAEIVLYTRKTRSDEFSRIVPSSDKYPRCVVQKRDLTLYIDHFSEWWIIAYIRRYFIGKRLICTPYVPLSTSRYVMNCVFLTIKDDVNGTKEDVIPDYKVAFPGEQYSVRWGQGPLKITHLENELEVSTKELEECAFYDMTTHRIPFVLQPRVVKLAGILLTFILKQKITKYITFPMRYNDECHDSRSTQSGLVRSTFSIDRGESLDDGRKISQASMSSLGFAEEMKSSQHHLKAVDSASAEPVDSNDGSKVRMSPHSSNPSQVESLHPYHVTHAAEAGEIASASAVDNSCVSAAVADDTMDAQAPPAFVANILQEAVPGLPVDQRSGNVAIYVREMNITSPQGNTSTIGPVPIATIVPPKLQHDLRWRLNRYSPALDDWRGLAIQLQLGDYIQSLEQCKNPTGELLVIAESRQKIQNLEDLAKAFYRINRGDCEELCNNYAFEGRKAGVHKDQMEDEDTDSSDT